MLSYRLAWLTLGATFALVAAGGLVHATGSALACPDWPLCYGSALPTMEQGVLYEHSHRLIGALVGLLTATLAALLLRGWRGAPRLRRIGWSAYGIIVLQVLLSGRLGMLISQARATGESSAPTGLIALAALFGGVVITLALTLARRGAWQPALGLALGEIVVIQSTLGGVTVLMRLPTLVSTTHLATSMLFVAGLLLLIAELRPAALRGAQPARGVVAATVAIYLQLVLGAVVRHTGAGLACHTDLLTCQGAWLPNTGPGWLLAAHRLAGVLVAAGVVTVAWPVARRGWQHPEARLAWAAGVLVLLQVGLGLWTVLSYVAVSLATAHLITGALIFADLLTLSLWMRPAANHALPAAAVQEAA